MREVDLFLNILYLNIINNIHFVINNPFYIWSEVGIRVTFSSVWFEPCGFGSVRIVADLVWFWIRITYLFFFSKIKFHI